MFKMLCFLDFLFDQFILSTEQSIEQNKDFLLFSKVEKLERNIKKFTMPSLKFKAGFAWDKKWKTKTSAEFKLKKENEIDS